MHTEIESAVIKAIAAQKHLDEGSIGIDAALDELGISSLDAITIIYDIEERLDLEIPNESVEELTTVRDIVDRIAELAGRGD